GVGVRGPEVHTPVRRNALREVDRVGDSSQVAVAALQRGVPELSRVADDVGVPAEDVAVEGDDVFVVPGVELEPAGRARLAEGLEPGMRAGLPAADGATTWIAQHEHGPEVGYGHRRTAHARAVARTAAHRLPRAFCG